MQLPKYDETQEHIITWAQLDSENIWLWANHDQPLLNYDVADCSVSSIFSKGNFSTRQMVVPMPGSGGEEYWWIRHQDLPIQIVCERLVDCDRLVVYANRPELERIEDCLPFKKFGISPSWRASDEPQNFLAVQNAFLDWTHAVEKYNDNHVGALVARCVPELNADRLAVLFQMAKNRGNHEHKNAHYVLTDPVFA